MATPKSTVSTEIIPYIFYRDVPAALDWLTRAFGFAETMRTATPSGGTHGEMTLDGQRIMMGQGSKEWRRPRRASLVLHDASRRALIELRSQGLACGTSVSGLCGTDSGPFGRMVRISHTVGLLVIAILTAIIARRVHFPYTVVAA